MTQSIQRPISLLLMSMAALLLAACQTMPKPTGFTPAQVAVLKTEGFVETPLGWELTFADRVLFAVNDSSISPDQIARIGTLTHNLLSVGITNARVEGHTDSTGASDYNLRLSQDRAQAVATPMRENGMPLTSDQVVGRGETLPLSSNDTADGRQDNRRVVIIVTPQ